MPRFPSIRAALAALLAAAAFAGCVVVPADRYEGEVVMAAPPPPRVEVYGPPPVVGWIWLGGYWSWSGGRHLWVPGHWAAPRPGYRWEPHRWVPQGRGWRHAPGHWERG